MGQLVPMPARRDVAGGGVTEPLVKEERIAEHFDVTTRTVRRWREQGMPSHRSRNGARRYRVGECEGWWEQHIG